MPITDSSRYYALDLKIKRTDGTYQYIVVPFNQDSSDWQYVSDIAQADSDYTEVTIYEIYVSKSVDQQTATNSYQYQNDLLSGVRLLKMGARSVSNTTVLLIIPRSA